MISRSSDHLTMAETRTETLFITGAAAGIGAAIARLATSRGYSVGLIDRESSVEELAAQLAASGEANARAWTCDVSDEEALASAIDAAANTLGKPSKLVTAAGIDRGGALDELPLSVWDEVLRVNLRGTAAACQAVLPHMIEQQGGAILCLSSPLARTAIPGGSAAYAASKGGVSALARSLAIEYAGRGIRVNALLPGPTETKLMWSGVDDAEVPRMREIVAAEVPLGRIASPDEVARAALWLLSDDASYITGAEIPCDGGLLARAAISQ